MIVKARASLLGANQLHNVSLLRMLIKQTLYVLPTRTRRRAHRHNFSQRIDGLARRTRIGIGSKITRSQAVLLTRVLNSRKHVSASYRNVGIAFIVLKVDVKVRVILLNKVSLKYQRLVFGAYHHIIKRSHELHHERNFLAVVRKRHILLHTGAQVFGFAYVDNLTSGVFPQVAARVGRHLRHLFIYRSRNAVGNFRKMTSRRMSIKGVRSMCRTRCCRAVVIRAIRHYCALLCTTSPIKRLNLSI